MKNIALIAFSVISLVSCNEQAKTDSLTKEKTEESKNIQTIGGQKDEHGCLTAAGQTWSELRKTCLQIFSEGIRLNPIDVKGNEAVISAFALFNSDKSKVELFLADSEETIIIDKNKNGLYENAKYSYNPQTESLSIDGKLTYKK